MDKEKITVDSVKNFETEVDYTTVLDNFEGPLDLLLYLIKEERIEIKDVFVSRVTEQFLSYMKALPHLDVEKASEYLNIAATIIDIKARSLVPPPDYDEWQEGEEFEDYEPYSPEQELIQALEEYQTAKKLKERETIGYIFKEPDKEYAAVQVQYSDMTLEGLMDAFTKMMVRLETKKRSNPPPREIPKDVFTVKDKIKHIREHINAKDSMQFEELFTNDYTTPEIVTTFQALLELLKHQILMVEQDDLFSTILIKKNPNRSEDEEIGEIDEYN
jgi:segregation and condensation protein A